MNTFYINITFSMDNVVRERVIEVVEIANAYNVITTGQQCQVGMGNRGSKPDSTSV